MQGEGGLLQHATSLGGLVVTAALLCPSQRAATCLPTKIRTSKSLIFKQIISLFLFFLISVESHPFRELSQVTGVTQSSETPA